MKHLTRLRQVHGIEVASTLDPKHRLKHLRVINSAEIIEFDEGEVYVETTRAKANKLADFLETKGYKSDKSDERMGLETLEQIVLTRKGVKGYVVIKSVPYYDHLARILVVPELHKYL